MNCSPPVKRLTGAVATGTAAYSFVPGRSVLHRMSAGPKIAALFAVSVFVFSFGIFVCALVFVILLLGARVAGIRVRCLFRGSRAFLMMAVFVVMFRSFNFVPFSYNREGFLAGLSFAASLFTAFAAGRLFFAVTAQSAVAGAASRINPRLALALALMLGFIPRFFAVWYDRASAWKARGGKTGPSALAFLVTASLCRMLEIAADTALALEARGGAMETQGSDEA